MTVLAAAMMPPVVRACADGRARRPRKPREVDCISHPPVAVEVRMQVVAGVVARRECVRMVRVAQRSVDRNNEPPRRELALRVTRSARRIERPAGQAQVTALEPARAH